MNAAFMASTLRAKDFPAASLGATAKTKLRGGKKKPNCFPDRKGWSKQNKCRPRWTPQNLPRLVVASSKVSAAPWPS
jgi:hypothetical protein